MLMMMPVVRGPPQRTSLRGTGAQYREDELPGAVGFEGLVGEVAVIKPGYGKHAQEEETCCEHQGKGTNAGEERQQTGEVQEDKRYHTDHIKSA